MRQVRMGHGARMAVGLAVGAIALGRAWTIATAAPVEPAPVERPPVCTAYQDPVEDTYVEVDGTTYRVESC